MYIPVFSEETHNIMDFCSETTSLHVYTQLQFFLKLKFVFHVCVRLALAGRRREIEKPRTAPDIAKGLEEDGTGPSDGGGERGIFKHKGQGQARWAFSD